MVKPQEYAIVIAAERKAAWETMLGSETYKA